VSTGQKGSKSTYSCPKRYVNEETHCTKTKTLKTTHALNLDAIQKQATKLHHCHPMYKLTLCWHFAVCWYPGLAPGYCNIRCCRTCLARTSNRRLRQRGRSENAGAENVGAGNERLRYFVVSVVHTMFIYGTAHCGCLFSAEPWS